MTNFNVDIKTLGALNLGFEQYFVLYSLYIRDEELLTYYVSNCKKIDVKVFEDLASRGYLAIADMRNIYYSSLTLTDRGRSLFDTVQTKTLVLEDRKIAEANLSRFDEFRKNYPSRVKEGFKSRPLHTDLAKCRKMYLKLMEEFSHETLCKCARLYHQDKKRANSEWYMQELPTWLSKRNFEPYLDQEEKPNGGDVEREFTDDI